MVSSTEQLGLTIGQALRQGQTTSQNLNGQTVKTTKKRVVYEDVELACQAIFTKKVPLSDSFIIDHPVKGELDSATLKLDGGYDGAQEQTLATYNF